MPEMHTKHVNRRRSGLKYTGLASSQYKGLYMSSNVNLMGVIPCMHLMMNGKWANFSATFVRTSKNCYQIKGTFWDRRKKKESRS
ncbi:hypothetical protein V3C99_010749 [Haemonchus contortus]|uniref:Ovule protein n=1 Tax=Haemonchus contortus TaxID=6289 RepID=A0A7I4Y6F2_HAECO